MCDQNSDKFYPFIPEKQPIIHNKFLKKNSALSKTRSASAADEPRIEQSSSGTLASRGRMRMGEEAEG
jgi:hypothetical protein